ncbi:potassium channel family protein [Aliagarivorans taiwanensis]|uniref:potassium channel family protein n=1 Tax=Aliagarivorans taiwanensis TaxID=561966 RepID=UPI0003F708C6|nr:potassium channel family protein [Aliagarivorans taiwanensis]
MHVPHHPDNHRAIGAMDVAMAFLSLLLVLGGLVSLTGDRDNEFHRAVLGLDTLICSVLLLHWFWGLFTAPHKRSYLKERWIDVIASIPMLEVTRPLRLLQIWRVISVFRRHHRALEEIQDEPLEITLALAVLGVLLAITASTLVMVLVEIPDPNSPFEGAADIIWWSVVTLSTVGYGDYVPTSMAGRAVASIVILAGVSVFGAFTAYVTSLMMSASRNAHERELLTRLERLERSQKQILEELRRLGRNK